MNQVVALAATAMVLIWSAAGCAPATVNQRTDADSGTVRIDLPRCALQGQAAADSCSVTVFDGATTVAAQRESGDRWSIAVDADTATGARIALYSAPGFVPVVQAVRAVPGAPSTVTLDADVDARGGYLVGVVFRKSEVLMDGGACAIESFVARQDVIINRVRARFVIATDALGSFVKKLPAGEYTVQAENVSQTVSVPHADSRLVVLALEPNKRIIE
jgi:hypothetical protein